MNKNDSINVYAFLKSSAKYSMKNFKDIFSDVLILKKLFLNQSEEELYSVEIFSIAFEIKVK